jgi:hypothetical protein
MTDDARGFLLRQFDLAWKLLTYHLDDLTTADCLRRPAGRGLHVHRVPKGVWRADWPEHEGYALGPSSLAWLTWHVCFWWSMVVDHSFGMATLTRDHIPWPGDADAVRDRIGQLHDMWRELCQVRCVASRCRSQRLQGLRACFLPLLRAIC